MDVSLSGALQRGTGSLPMGVRPCGCWLRPRLTSSSGPWSVCATAGPGGLPFAEPNGHWGLLLLTISSTPIALPLWGLCRYQNCQEPAPKASSAHRLRAFGRLLLERSWQGTEPGFSLAALTSAWGKSRPAPPCAFAAPRSRAVPGRGPETPCE